LSVQTGQNQIEILGLSSAIDTESARVSGLGDARLFDVVCTINRQDSKITLGNSFEEAVRILEAKKQELKNEKSIVLEQSNILSEYAKTLSGEHVSPQDMVTFMQSFVPQQKECLRTVSELDGKILDLERQIAKEREILASWKGKAEAKVSVVIVAQIDGPVKLNLTYSTSRRCVTGFQFLTFSIVVNNALWQPTYELHATTVNGKTSTSVSLHYRAKISQTTGEDWRDTALILSTNPTDMMMGGIPPLSKSNLTVSNLTVAGKRFPGFVPNVPVAQKQHQAHFVQTTTNFGAAAKQSHTIPQPGQFFAPTGTTSLFGAPPGIQSNSPFAGFGAEARTIPEKDDWDSAEELSSPEMHPVAEGVAVVNKSSLSVSYAVEGASTIQSDGESHKVSVAVLPFEADVTWITMPRQQAVVYMQASISQLAVGI
jgi:Domain of unknown function (DUF4139)/N-terminal domain of unknown function (DUF4140)